MEKIKAFHVRVPVSTWKFLKKRAFDKEISMNKVVAECLDKFKSKYEKKLTDSGTMVP